MPQMDFFPQRPEVHPMIYAYRDLNPDYDGLLKVGYTEKDVDRRVAQQYPTKRPDGKLPYEILYRSSAMREDGSCFYRPRCTSYAPPQENHRRGR